MNDRLGLSGCFAALATGETAAWDRMTGEVRIPLAVYSVEGRMGRVEFVLSQADAESMRSCLARGLAKAEPASLPVGGRPARSGSSW